MAHLHAHPSEHEHTPETAGRLIRWARFYDPFVNVLALGRRRRLRQQTLALATITAGATVVEIGCGTGDVTLLAARAAGPSGTVTGIDPAPEMVALARKKAQAAGLAAHFQVGVAEQLPFADASIDVVFSSLMMHHLTDDLKQRAFYEVKRVLKPGGQVVIVDFARSDNLASKFFASLLLHPTMRLGVQDLAPLLRAAGFTQLSTGSLGLMRLGFVRAVA